MAPAHTGPMIANVLDHDLPVLAAGYELPHAPDWESLIGDGVEPSLVLGAERRLEGSR